MAVTTTITTIFFTTITTTLLHVLHHYLLLFSTQLNSTQLYSIMPLRFLSPEVAVGRCAQRGQRGVAASAARRESTGFRVLGFYVQFRGLGFGV